MTSNGRVVSRNPGHISCSSYSEDIPHEKPAKDVVVFAMVHGRE